MRRYDTDDFNLAGFVVDLNLGNLCRVDVSAERLALTRFRIHGDGRRIPRCAPDRRLAEGNLGAFGDLADHNTALRKTLDLNSTVSGLELARHDLQHRRGNFE